MKVGLIGQEYYALRSRRYMRSVIEWRRCIPLKGRETSTTDGKSTVAKSLERFVAKGKVDSLTAEAFLII